MPPSRIAPAGRQRWLRHWPLLPALALGAALRLWGLFPTYLFGDEAEYATVARSLSEDWRGLAYPPLEQFGPAPFVSQPPLLLYTFALAIRMAGFEAGPILVSVVLGTATIAVVYGLGVRLADRWLGGLAAMFLAVLPPHVGLSRNGQLDAGFTFFVALAMLAFLWWAANQRPLRALVAGLAVSAAMLAKLPGVLVAIPIGVVLAGMALGCLARASRGDPQASGDLRRIGRHTVLASVPPLLLGSLYVAMLWHLNATRDLTRKLGWQADRVSGGTGSRTQRAWDWYFTDPGVGLQAQLGLVLLVLAAAGLLMLLIAAMRARRDRPDRALAIAWPVAFLAFFLLSDRKEWFYLAPVLPAIALLAACAVHRAWLATLWPKGLPIAPAAGRRRAAILAAAVLATFAILAPASASMEQRVQEDGVYGSGVKEAALWIHGQDPQAAQVGSLLGRFTLHLYNGHTTYHYYVNHTFLEHEIEEGNVRYVVRDPYLNLTYERLWMQDLVERHNGTLAKEFVNDRGRAVQVYRLSS